MKPDAALRAALYARVSTRDKGQEVENQLIELRRFCVAQGWLIMREYRECESGGTAARAELQAMLRDATQRLRLSQRVRVGLERARRLGKRLGRPRAVLDREQARQLRTQGWSWGRIAQALGVSKAAVRRACQSPGRLREVCQ